MSIDSVQYRAMQDAADLITALGLPSNPPAVPAGPTGVFVQGDTDESNLTYPCILLTAEGMKEEESPKTFVWDGVTYKIAVLVLDRASQRDQTVQATYASWRHSIMKMFRAKVLKPVLANTPECWRLRLEEDVVFDYDTGKKYQHMRSGFTLLVDAAEARTAV